MNFEPRFHQRPEDVLPAISLALCVMREQVLATTPGGSSVDRGQRPTYRDRPPIVARFLNVQPLDALRSVEAIIADRLLSIRGNVTRVSGVRPMVRHMCFQCTRCGQDQWADFVQGKFEPPVRCADPGGTCRGDKFVALYATSVAVDRQVVRLQELESDVAKGAGDMPRSIEVRCPLLIACHTLMDVMNDCDVAVFHFTTTKTAACHLPFATHRLLP